MDGDPIRAIMTLIDEHQNSLPEGVYIELCDNIKRIYAMGEDVQKIYILNITNDYLKALENVETLQNELVYTKRELLRSRISRFEHVSRPLTESRGMLETLLGRSSDPTTVYFDTIPLPPRN
jgi:hypothetical protein